VSEALPAPEGPPIEELELDPAWDLGDPARRDAEQARDPRRRPRRHDQALAGSRPAAKARRPPPGQAPAGRRSGLDRSQEGKLGPVQLPYDRHTWMRAQRGLVRRRQVMEMEQVGLGRSRPVERLRPVADQPLVVFVVDRGEDAIGGARPVLVGGLEGNARRRRVIDLQGGRIVDRNDIDPGKETQRVPGIGPAPERTGGKRHVPACSGQGSAERAGDLRRAAARKEEERRDDATAGAAHGRAAPSPPVPARIHARVSHRWTFSPRKRPQRPLADRARAAASSVTAIRKAPLSPLAVGKSRRATPHAPLAWEATPQWRRSLPSLPPTAV
jgi:hypothetical protein